MVKSWAMRYLPALGALSTARAACDDLDNYLNVPQPLTEDTTINLSVDVIECATLDLGEADTEYLEQVVVEGGTLTIASGDTVQFINLSFLVMPGAALVFDMPGTIFGPTDEFRSSDEYHGSHIEVSDGASLTFNGDTTIQDVLYAAQVLEIYGTTEFKKKAVIQNNSGGVRVITGTLKFRDDALFQTSPGIGLWNSDGGFVRFSATATFDGIGSSVDGYLGCIIINRDATSKISFRGDAVLSNTFCGDDGTPPVYNNGIMNFYGKARFDFLTSGSNGGAVGNHLGSMTFRRAAQFNNNKSNLFGGGIGVDGGDVTFKKAVKFSGNTARSGGAFAVGFGEKYENGIVIDSGFGSLSFEKPSVVRFADNTVDTEDGDDENCTVGEVEEGATLIGFPDDDVCVATS